VVIDANTVVACVRTLGEGECGECRPRTSLIETDTIAGTMMAPISPCTKAPDGLAPAAIAIPVANTFRPTLVQEDAIRTLRAAADGGLLDLLIRCQREPN
jgi:hypothetical protein